MTAITKLLARFRAKPAPISTTQPHLDAEFLDAAMQVARNRTEADQHARKELASRKLPD